MARARLVKPEFFSSPVVGELTYRARLLFQSIWTEADDYGVIKESIPLFRTKAFPFDAETDEHIAADVAHMIDLGLLYRAQAVPVKKDVVIADATIVDVLVVTSWAEHQSPPKPTRKWRLVGDMLDDVLAPQPTEVTQQKGLNFGGIYATAWKEAHGDAPTQASIKRVAGAAKKLVDKEGRDPAVVEQAVVAAALSGHANVDSAYLMVVSKATRKDGYGRGSALERKRATQMSTVEKYRRMEQGETKEVGS